VDDPRLRATRFIDHEHPRVRAFVEEVCAEVADPLSSTGKRERAVRLFVAVRDRVRYDPYAADLAPDSLTASASIERGKAFCVPKAILYAATLRAVGIPSRLGFADVTNHLATRRLLDLLKTGVFAYHGYVVLELEGRTLKATPAFDARLCAYFGVEPLAFDGRSDAMLQPFDKQGRAFLEYLKDRGVHDDLPYDDMLAAWRELYPHLFGLHPLAGDLAAEVERERGNA
jgi:transglutaminase-like putative cysteine protease